MLRSAEMRKCSRSPSSIWCSLHCRLLCLASYIALFVLFFWDDESILDSETFQILPSFSRANSYCWVGYRKLHRKQEFNLSKMYSDWSSLHEDLHRKISGTDFRGPSVTSCFLWLPDCYNLAKHPSLAKEVEAILGPNVILYSMELLKTGNETAGGWNRSDDESGTCPHVADVVIGRNIRMMKGSHLYEPTIRDQIRKGLNSLVAVVGTSNLQEYMVSEFARNVLKRNLGNPEKATTEFSSVEADNNTLIIIHGKAIYRTEACPLCEFTLILKFASASCQIKSITSSSNNIFLHPVLIISGISVTAVVSDFRDFLVANDTAFFEPKSRTVATALYMSPHVPEENGLGFYSWKQCTEAMQLNDTCTYGFASTSRFSALTFQYFSYEFMSSGGEALVTSQDEKVLIMLHGTASYQLFSKDVLGYREMFLLDIHNSTHVPKHAWYALSPASPGLLRFVSVSWTAWDTENEKTQLTSKVYSMHETVVLKSGQAYDPVNEDNCDVILVMLYGQTLQIFPWQTLIDESESLLISGSEPCLLWNGGKQDVRFVIIRVCKDDEIISKLFNGDLVLSSYFNFGGKIMRKLMNNY